MNDSEKASTKLATHCTSPAQLSLSLSFSFTLDFKKASTENTKNNE